MVSSVDSVPLFQSPSSAYIAAGSISNCLYYIYKLFLHADTCTDDTWKDCRIIFW